MAEIYVFRGILTTNSDLTHVRGLLALVWFNKRATAFGCGSVGIIVSKMNNYWLRIQMSVGDKALS